MRLRILALVLVTVPALSACAGPTPDDAVTDRPGQPGGSTPAGDGPVLVALDAAADDLPAIGVDEALVAEHGARVVVSGALFVDADGTIRLCDAIAESFPPQCGGNRIVVEGLDLADVPGLEQANGVRWAESAQVVGSIKH